MEVPAVYPNDENYQERSVYWISGNHTDGFTLNTKTDDTFTVYYAFRPEDMDTDADICVIPDPEAVVAHAYAFLRKSETDPLEDADKSLQECDSRLAEIISAKRINENFGGFDLMENA